MTDITNKFYAIAHIDLRSDKDKKGWNGCDNSYLIADNRFDNEEAAIAEATKLVGNGDHDDLFILTAIKRFLADPQPLTVTDLV